MGPDLQLLMGRNVSSAAFSGLIPRTIPASLSHSMTTNFMRTIFLLLVLASFLPAQWPAGANALSWDGATSQVGPICWGFNCLPEQATIRAGERGTFFLRGDLNQWYVLALSPQASPCATLPGAFNGFGLGNQVFVLTSGLLSTNSPVRPCQSGLARIPATLPTTVTPGTSFAVQALVGVFPQPGQTETASFSQTIVFTVI